MQLRHMRLTLAVVCGVLLAGSVLNCAPEWRWCLLNGNCGGTAVVAGSTFISGSGSTFTELLIDGRTFTGGQAVTTVTYRVGDLTRAPVLIDFNGDRRVDPVVGYNQEGKGIVQILLSYGELSAGQLASLTLDGGENAWKELTDLAVGDLDGDGNLDIVIATQDGVVYMHHPADPGRTHVLNEWGQPTGALEMIAGTTESISNEELTAILAQEVGVGTNLDNYIVTVEQGYTSVEIADFDRDGNNDIAASRRLHVQLTPKPDLPLETIDIVAGSVQVLINPGGAEDGVGWTTLALGTHERHDVLDREGARDLRAYDLSGDGYFDLISTATDDQNVQVAWFENPGGGDASDPAATWLQHRIGSVRGAFTIDVADLTGDGLVDVVATSPEQLQLTLFVQPTEVNDRGFDWYTVSIVNFESFEPRAVKALDVNNDGILELVVGGTRGALRYFESPTIPFDEWTGHIIVTFDPPGDGGRLGYGDLDGDGDADVVAILNGDDPAANHVSWVRNELIE
jgi:hypothetical protein